MAGLSPKLPLFVSATDGFYGLNVNYREVVKQNIKMLILTAPGERMMDPNFGVGARNFLFENAVLVKPRLYTKIKQQVSYYMSYVTIRNLDIFNLNDNHEIVVTPSMVHTLGIKIDYYVKNMNLADSLSITQFNTGAPAT